MEKSFSKIKMYLSDKNFWTTLSIELLGVIVFFVPHPLAYLVGIIIIICGAVYAYFKGHTIDEKLNKTGKTLEEQKRN